MKLSPKQKEVIKAMREKADVFAWVGTPICKYTFRGKTFRYDLAEKIHNAKLIESRIQRNGIGLYQLTELGKNCEL